MDETAYNERLERARSLLPSEHWLYVIALGLAWGRDITILPVPGRDPWRNADRANAEQPRTPGALVKSANA